MNTQVLSNRIGCCLGIPVPTPLSSPQYSPITHSVDFSVECNVQDLQGMQAVLDFGVRYSCAMVANIKIKERTGSVVCFSISQVASETFVEELNTTGSTFGITGLRLQQLIMENTPK